MKRISGGLKLAGRNRRVALALAACALMLSGCGVKSAPKTPLDSTYPRQYPEPLPELKFVPQEQKPESARPGAAAPLPPSGVYQYPNPPAYRPPEQ